MVTVLILLSVHFVADFLLQTDWMATNKSKRWDALALHVTVYTACFAVFGFAWAGDSPQAARFVLVTWVTHFITDALTSRLTSRLWFFRRAAGIWVEAPYTVPRGGGEIVNPWLLQGGNRHYFFVAIGFDQLIHAYTLALTWRLLFPASL